MAAVPNRLHEVAARDPAPWEQRDVIFRSERVRFCRNQTIQTDQTTILVCSSQIQAHCALWLACCGTQELSNRSSSSEAFLGLKPQTNIPWVVPNQRVGLAISRPEYQPCQASPPASSWIALAEGECLIVFSCFFSRFQRFRLEGFVRVAPPVIILIHNYMHYAWLCKSLQSLTTRTRIYHTYPHVILGLLKNVALWAKVEFQWLQQIFVFACFYSKCLDSDMFDHICMVLDVEGLWKSGLKAQGFPWISTSMDFIFNGHTMVIQWSQRSYHYVGSEFDFHPTGSLCAALATKLLGA